MIGIGELKKRKEEIQRLKNIEKLRIKKEKLKLIERMKHRHFKASSIEIPDLSDSDNDNDDNIIETKLELINDISKNVTNDTELTNLKNIGNTKIPFNNLINWNFIYIFHILIIILFLILLFYNIIIINYYNITEIIISYNIIKSNITITSIGILVFCMYNDIKEIYYTMKYIIPIRMKWIPFITIDISDEINALFINNYKIKLENIKEINSFSIEFIYLCIIGIFLGNIPYNLLILLLRNNNYMNFTIQRIISPIFGTIIIIRALLGSNFYLKIIFFLNIIYNYNMNIRESIGIAIQSYKTYISIIIFSFLYSFIALFFTSMLYPSVIGLSIALGFIIGIIYGLLNGIYHSLPIKPFLYITTLKHGTWLRINKTEKCLCRKNGQICTELNTTEEILIIYTTDDFKFNNLLKNGMGTSS